MVDIEKKSILVIDDEEAIRQSFTDYLEDMGYRVLAAENGRVGVDMFDRKSADLVLVDLRMPEMDGLEVLAHIAQKSPGTPLIVVSGTGVISDAVEALHQGAWDYILKPVKDLSVLTHSVDMALEKARLKEENRQYQNHLEQMVARSIDKIRDREERLGAIIQSAMDGFLICDLRGRILDVNDTVCNMFGYGRTDLLSTYVLDLYASNIVPQDRTEIKKILEKEKSHRFETRCKRKDGSVIDVEVSAQKIDRDEGIFVTFIRDITGIKEMEKHLQQSQKMEAIGTLAGGIAHDFNNILSSILGFTELAKLRGSADQKLQDNLDQVITSGLRAKELVKQILTFSRRSDAQKMVLKITPLVKESLKLLRAFISPNIEIHTRLDSVDDYIYADTTQIHQVIMNVLTNAVHAMKESGGVLDVGLESIEITETKEPSFSDAEPGRYVQLTISDTGHGIPGSKIGKIFEPFFSTKARGEGTGLGLSTTYGIIKDMRGHIFVDSKEGVGTSFRILVPQKTDGVLPIENEKENDVIPGQGTVLLVDDEASIVEWTSLALSKLGYTVESASGGPEALGLFRKDPSRYDLVLTDLSMPRMTGLNLAKLIKTERSDIPIILCTGFSEELTADTLKAHGISKIIMKPLIVSELSKVLAESLTKKHSPGV